MRPTLHPEVIGGAAGRIEAVRHDPVGTPVGMCIVGHPHPLFGGTMDNKVAQTLARTFCELGCVTWRFNMRGVGATEGSHDEGRGETDDAQAVLTHARAAYGDLPLVLTGFSFGAYVIARLAERVKPRHLALVAPSVNRGPMPPAPVSTLVVHGEVDETVPLTDVLDWARPLEVPVVLVPGCEHFFHGRLHQLKAILVERFSGRIAG